jgi:hypothetical protein
MDSTYFKCCNLCVDQYLERPKFLKALTLVKILSLYNLKGYKKKKPNILPWVNFWMFIVILIIEKKNLFFNAFRDYEHTQFKLSSYMVWCIYMK